MANETIIFRALGTLTRTLITANKRLNKNKPIIAPEKYLI